MRQPAVIRILHAIALFTGLLALAACQREQPATVLTVAVAANAVPYVEDLAAVYTKDTGVRIVVTSGSSGNLARQVREGAPFDLFISADVARIDELATADLIVSRCTYAEGVLVLWTRENPPTDPAKIDTGIRGVLQRAKVVAIASPEQAPYGRAAMEVLEAIHLQSEILPRLIYGENVGQVRQFAESGNADAAFLPISLAPQSGSVMAIPPEWHRAVVQDAAVIKGRPQVSAAKAFLDRLCSPESDIVRLRHGYRIHSGSGSAQ